MYVILKHGESVELGKKLYMDKASAKARLINLSINTNLSRTELMERIDQGYIFVDGYEYRIYKLDENR